MPWIVHCPAKLNLFLSVAPRDSRGYHPLRTVFQAIDLCDTLSIELGDDGHEVRFDQPGVPERNTITRALSLLAEIVDLPALRVEVTKRIPMESGLGGGSSDAAGLIRAAAAISGLAIPEAELFGLAQTLGADVPFFLIGGRARAEGYGERLTPVPDGPDEWFVIARPDEGCPTPEMYSRLDSISYDWRGFPESDELYNDFERVAPCASLELIERLLALGARDAALSGSGSAVFGRFAVLEDAERVRASLTRENSCRSWIARSLRRQECLAVERS